MSSRDDGFDVLGWLVVATAVGLMALYATGQLEHTLAFARAWLG